VNYKPVFYVVYLRVSTSRQGEDGLGVDAQRAAVEAFAFQHGGAIVGQYVEVESGKRSDRPELAKALDAARRGRATLLVAKLDRLARNLSFIAALMDAGVEFVACNQLYASRFTLHILAAVAEVEAHRISERTKAALKAAKARGIKLGSPIAAETAATARAARSAMSYRKNSTTRTVIEDIQRSGVALAGIAKVLEARGVKTPASRACPALSPRLARRIVHRSPTVGNRTWRHHAEVRNDSNPAFGGGLCLANHLGQARGNAS
jgi:DNA invertase Pin-like site-specific DNA recombinase